MTKYSAAPSQGETSRGRKPSGQTIHEIQRKATKKRVKRLLSEGKTRLDTFVSNETLTGLDTLKQVLECNTKGDVIDYLIRHYTSTHEKSNTNN